MSYIPNLLMSAALFVVSPTTADADLRVSAHDSDSYVNTYVASRPQWRHNRHRYRNYDGYYYYPQRYRSYYRSPGYYYYYDSPRYYDYYYYPRGSVRVGPLQFYWR